MKKYFYSFLVSFFVLSFSFLSCQKEDYKDEKIKELKTVETNNNANDLIEQYATEHGLSVEDISINDNGYPRVVKQFTEEEYEIIISIGENMKEGELLIPFHNKKGQFQYFYGDKKIVEKQFQDYIGVPEMIWIVACSGTDLSILGDCMDYCEAQSEMAIFPVPPSYNVCYWEEN